MLQKEQSAFSDFVWYRQWSEEARQDRFLRWLHDTRNDFVKAQALEPKSWMTMRCIDNPRQSHFDEYGEEDDGPLTYKVSPFACTHYYIGTGWRTDHAHEFTRQWAMEGLDVELLDACAQIYDHLDDLVLEAHRRLGATMQPIGIKIQNARCLVWKTLHNIGLLRLFCVTEKKFGRMSQTALTNIDLSVGQVAHLFRNSKSPPVTENVIRARIPKFNCGNGGPALPQFVIGRKHQSRPHSSQPRRP